MKKSILILIFILSFIISYSQADSKYEIYVIDLSSKVTNDVKKCEAGKKQAILDAKDGEYNYVCFGGNIVNNNNYNEEKYKFNKFYNNYIKKKYSLKVINSIVPRDFTKCYSIEMNKIIFEKYGKNIIKKSKREALKEYKKLNQNRN